MTNPADDQAMIVLTRREYDVVRDVVSSTTRLFNGIGPHQSETWAIWNQAINKIACAHRYERPLADATTEELLAEVARRMQQSAREAETEPSPPIHADPPEDCDDETRLLRRHRDCRSDWCALSRTTECPFYLGAPAVEVPEPEPEGEDTGLTAREVTARYRGELAGISDETGWAEMDAEALAKKVATLRDLLAGGIPADIPITHTPDVLALYGVDPDEMAAACRMPTRVEIRPESIDKKYAVLAFFRGDMQVIVGFRFPRHPGVMAVYLGSMLQHDTHHVEHTGGGGSKTGARGQNSLPTTPKQLVNRLKASGCTVELDPSHTDGITHKVTFRGEEMGLIKTERQPRAQVQSDYNRFLRRMQAIERQKATA